MPFLFILLCALAGREAWEQGLPATAAACAFSATLVAAAWLVGAVRAWVQLRRIRRALAAQRAACDRFYTTFYEEL